MRRARPAAAAALPSRAWVVVSVLVAAIVASVVAVPVLAHGNHATLDSQVSSDGVVVVESGFASTDAFLVVHRVTADGELGEVAGHTEFPVVQGFAYDVEVPIERTAWADWQTQEVLVVLHRNDGGDGFDPDEDPALYFVGGLAGERITLEKGPAAYVGASGRGERVVTDGSVSVPQVRLGTDGYLVLRARENGEPGGVIGYTVLPTGTHTDVAVGLNDSFLANANQSFDLYAELYRDDGDGSFDPDADEPVRAGDDPVRTLFSATLATGQNGTTDDGPDLNTPSPTQRTGTSEVTETPTTRPAETATRTTGPGFTALAAVGTLTLAGVALVVRRR